MKAPALGEAATHLRWLSPSAASLVALARAPAEAWAQVCADPGALLLIARQSSGVPLEGDRKEWESESVPALAPVFRPQCFRALLHDPAILDTAVRFLDHAGPGFVDWNQPSLQPIFQTSSRFARLARSLAERDGRGDPDFAWVAGMLAPLGWFAVCAIDPDQAAACLTDSASAKSLQQVQQRCWGFDQAAIARRLARRWRLPRWLAAVVGHLDLPVQVARMLGAEPDLFRAVQQAVGLVQREGPWSLLLSPLPQPDKESELPAPDAPTDEGPMSKDKEWTDPRSVPLLRELLVVAADNRRLQDAPMLDCLERDIDELHRGLQEQRASEEERLRARKLSALAELAAGAGHEINNPLAVISGQAQHLLQHEIEPARQQALRTIIAQAQRIHQILSDLMHFARPVRPQKQPVDAASLVQDVMVSLGELAAQRRVQLISPPPEYPVSVYADPGQIHTALGCLLRNAIEAAPSDGWAGIRLEMPSPDSLRVVVEDSGNGPSAAHQDHLFDPFYSGRQAGRGSGLGLAIAWRLAREHGGDVRFEEIPNGPTRFVLTLPRQTGNNGHAGL